MFLQRHVGVGRDLLPHRVGLVGADPGRPAGRAARRQVAALPLLGQVATDGADIDGEAAGDLGLGQAALGRGHDPGPQFGGIRFH